MTLGNALSFIDKVMSDDNYRKSFYAFESIPEVQEALEQQSLMFNFGHFEDAINKKVVDSASEEEANTFRQIEAWWNMLLSSLAKK